MAAALEGRERWSLALQRGVGRLLAPLWIPLLSGVMRWGLGWCVEGRAALRREYARLRAEPGGPLLVCANHLTMLDSFVIAWALGSPGFYLRHYAALPWNTPERRNFASTWWKRALVYVMKCVPVTRGSDRREVGRVLARIRHLLLRRETVLVFPEGARSRSGRVEPESAAYGVGRLVQALPGCRVLCVYLRGDGQASWSTAPRRDERFRVRLACFEPKTDHAGMRGSLDLARQIVRRLAELEREHFDGRQ
jgi:1-acyl-sn-glycerol-3-phosphate acyltransferase